MMCVGLRGLGDHADRGGGDAGFGADACGKGDLVAGADGDLRIAAPAAGGDVDEVDAVLAETLARSTDSSRVQPPSAQSVAEMRTKGADAAGQALRTASTTWRGRRMRFSKVPP